MPVPGGATNGRPRGAPPPCRLKRCEEPLVLDELLVDEFIPTSSRLSQAICQISAVWKFTERRVSVPAHPFPLRQRGKGRSLQPIFVKQSEKGKGKGLTRATHRVAWKSRRRLTTTVSFAKTAPTFTDQTIWPEALMRASHVL